MKVSDYSLEATVFIVGGVIMIFELVGSRVLGPYFGTSIFVWTSLIGIILGSLSLGYHFGGRLADRRATIQELSVIIFLSGVLIGLTIVLKDHLLIFLRGSIKDVRLSSVIAAIALFLPPSVFLGMVSPYAVRLKLHTMSTAGATIGSLYAISTAGSIVGTFLSGFYLIPVFGTNTLLMTLSLSLMLLSLLLFARSYTSVEALTLLFFLIVWSGMHAVQQTHAQNGFVDIDTPYNRVWIYDRVDRATQQPVKVMGINNENHSSMFLHSDELVNEYTKYYHLARHFRPDFHKTVMFGGAGYMFPRSFLDTYPSATMDVVEIDPKLTELARHYFRLKDDPRLTIIHEDARVFLNSTKNTYDVLFGDAFGSRYSVPYQLTTIEAVRKHYDILTDDGVVILNTISAIEGEKGEFLRAEYATYKEVFPHVYLIPVAHPEDGTIVQNVMLIAVKSKRQPVFDSEDHMMDSFLSHVWTKEIQEDMPILTDNFAPVEHYVDKMNL